MMARFTCRILYAKLGPPKCLTIDKILNRDNIIYIVNSSKFLEGGRKWLRRTKKNNSRDVTS